LADGVTVDLPSPVTGLLVKLLVSEDDRLTVGQPLAVLETKES
jgi:pyruvate/2-oxoglutarate dehydrogenase complex dihydrolipoamide acyltransferase (E2) component